MRTDMDTAALTLVGDEHTDTWTRVNGGAWGALSTFSADDTLDGLIEYVASESDLPPIEAARAVVALFADALTTAPLCDLAVYAGQDLYGCVWYEVGHRDLLRVAFDADYAVVYPFAGEEDDTDD